jgi:hypothetical protein
MDMPQTESVHHSPASVCLVLFFKAPATAKRRLAVQLGDASSDAAAHLLCCALEDLRAWPGDRVLAAAEKQDAQWLESELGDDLNVVLQRGRSLGERISHVDEALRRNGMQRALYIGSDCPQMDDRYLHAAAAALERDDAVLGPAGDGGVVVMGSRRPWPALGKLPWSSDRLAEALRALLVQQCWSVATLAQRHDVDTLDDLLRAADALTGDSRPARQALRRWVLERAPCATPSAS